MRVLVTRPEADSGALLNELQTLGVEGVLEPLLSVENRAPPPIEFSEFQAILLTSANGARAMAGIEGGRNLPVYAVGEATAAAAREAGFETVDVAGGDVDALFQRIKERIDAKAGALLHPAGTTVAGDLAADLVEDGYDYRRVNLYDAVAASKLSRSTVQAIKKGEISGVVLYSPRTAEVFVSLIRKARLIRAVKGLTAYCLSPTVTETAQKLDWQEIHVATEPTQAAFLRLFDGLKPEAPGPGNHEPEVRVSDKTVIPETAADTAAEIPADTPEAERPGEGIVELPVEKGPPRESRGRTGLFFANLIVIVLVVGIGAGTLPLWSPIVTKYYTGSEGASTEAQRITGLTGRISELEARAAANPPLDFKSLEAERARLQAQLDVTLRRLNTLEDSLGDVRKLAEATGVSVEGSNAAELKRLSDRLLRLEAEGGGATAENKRVLDAISGQVSKLEKTVDDSRPSDKARAVPAILVAVGQLREAVRASRLFTEEVAAIQALASGDAEIDSQLAILKPFAAKGVATAEQLRARFEQRAGLIVRAEIIPDGSGWVDRTISRLTEAVRWRRTNNLEENGVEAIVARAERKLATADIAGAISELSALSEKALAVAQPWIVDARSHVTAEAAIATL
ncbi:MAG: uroporphyrinogen-III synthase, partial [Proteobacteria bacterium]|nr:uroporphyrinogen-III synthase [Pseudomonadota bacterium]